MKKMFLVFLGFTFLYSCDSNETTDCSTVLCAGPATLAFEVLQNGQNIFDNESVSTQDVSFTGNFPNTYELQVEESNYNGGTKLLFVEQIDWEVTTYDFRIIVNSVESPELSTTIGLSEGDCCGGIAQISAFEVNGVILNNQNQVVTLNLD